MPESVRVGACAWVHVCVYMFMYEEEDLFDLLKLAVTCVAQKHKHVDEMQTGISQVQTCPLSYFY